MSEYKKQGSIDDENFLYLADKIDGGNDSINTIGEEISTKLQNIKDSIDCLNISEEIVKDIKEKLTEIDDDIEQLNSDLDTLNADLTDRFKSVNSGSIFDLKVSGIYYIRTAVTDRPVNASGMYILSYYSDSYNVGLFVPTYAAVSSNNKPYVQVNGTWIYSCDVSAVSTTSLMMNMEEDA